MTGSEPRLRLRDNPILVAQARRRLRGKQALPTLAIAVVLGLCGLLAGGVAKYSEAWLVVTNVGLFTMGAVLLLRGTVQVAGTMVDERASGILDFHRATPTTPWTDAIGYLIGPVAREYLVVAALLPFTLIASVLGGGNPLTVIVQVALIALGGVVLQSMALTMALSGGGRRSVSGSVMVVAMFLLFGAVPLHAAGFVTLSYLTPIPAMASLAAGPIFDLTIGGTVDFYGFPLHPIAWTLVVQGIAIGFLLWASARKLRRDETPAFSRPGAFLFFTIVTVLLIGGSWTALGTGQWSNMGGEDMAGVAVVAYLWAAAFLASILMASLAPGYMDLVRTTRRARRAGRAAPGWLEDGATALPVILAFAGLIVGGWLLVSVVVGRRVPMERLYDGHAALALACAAAVVAFVGSAIESMRLTMRGSYRSGLLLTAFLAFVLPWILTAIAAGATNDPNVAQWIASVSPLYGLGGSSISLGGSLAGEVVTLDLETVVFSLAVTLVATAWFVVRSASVRRGLTERVPLESKGRP